MDAADAGCRRGSGRHPASGGVGRPGLSARLFPRRRSRPRRRGPAVGTSGRVPARQTEQGPAGRVGQPSADERRGRSGRRVHRGHAGVLVASALTPMTRTITACLVACALALATAGLGAQSRLTLVPSASISSLFDTNVFARTDATGDQMTLVTPALEATYQTPSKMLFGAYTFDVQRSLL